MKSLWSISFGGFYKTRSLHLRFSNFISPSRRKHWFSWRANASAFAAGSNCHHFSFHRSSLPLSIPPHNNYICCKHIEKARSQVELYSDDVSKAIRHYGRRTETSTPLQHALWGVLECGHKVAALYRFVRAGPLPLDEQDAQTFVH